MKILGLKIGEPTEQGVSARQNLKYGDRHYFDVYRVGGEKLPVVVHFTGSGQEDRYPYAQMASAISAAGFAVVVASLPGSSAEDNLETVLQLSEHLKFWGAGEKLDLGSTFFSGDGTGAWTAFTAGLRSFEDGRFCIKPIGLLGFSGIYEPIELAKLDYRLANRALKNAFGIGKEGNLPEGVVRLIGESCPPIFFAHSDADNLSYSQTLLLKTAIRRAGVPYSEYHAAFRRVKQDFYKRPSAPEGASVSAAAVRFMTEVLKKADFHGEYTEI